MNGRNRIPGNQVVAVLLLACLLSGAGLHAGEPGEDADALGRQQVQRYFDALQDGDREAMAELLAPAFQIVRANDVVHAHDDYLADLPKVGEYSLEQVRATSDGRRLVVSYLVAVEETLEGVKQKTRAPRLTVFYRDGGDWLLLAHANFGALQQH